MSDIQKFRKAVNGFNRQDVVGYIEYLNNKHRSEINQLQNQLQVATRPIEDNGLKAENELQNPPSPPSVLPALSRSWRLIVVRSGQNAWL